MLLETVLHENIHENTISLIAELFEYCLYAGLYIFNKKSYDIFIHQIYITLIT